MKRTKAQRVLAAACGPALGVLLAVPVGGLLAGAAGADTTCYTGCTTPTTGHHHDAGGNADGWSVAGDDGFNHGQLADVEWTGVHRC